MKRFVFAFVGFVTAAVLLGVLDGSIFAAPGKSFPEVLPLPDGFQPEGIAVGRGKDFYVGSLGRPDDDGQTIVGGAIYKGDLRTGQGDILVPQQAGRTAVGLAVDRRSNSIFVAGGPFGAGYVYNASTGEEVALYQLVDPFSETFVNDVIVTRDAAFFTDSFRPVLYRLPLGPGGALPDESEVEEIALGGDFEHEPGEFNANGIEATPNGKHLIIVNTTQGRLYRIAPDTGGASLIDLGGDEAPNGDGLLLHGKTLYVVQNFRNQIAVIKLSADLGSGEVAEVITDPKFRIPTTVARFGSRLYVVNARFDVAPPFTDTDPSLEFEVVQVPRR